MEKLIWAAILLAKEIIRVVTGSDDDVDDEDPEDKD